MSGSIVQLRHLIEKALEDATPLSSLGGNTALNCAIRSAVFPGGKRMRPIFTLLATQATGADPRRALEAACAIEFLHSSSLVFDDLPCMDDAPLRRERPSLHVLYGESTALLAGLALFNEAYRLFGSHPELVTQAAACVGTDGMIGGQALDVHPDGLSLANGGYRNLRNRDCKTSGLMRLTFTAGPVCARAKPLDVALLGRCGDRLGRAYQTLDDLIDGSPCSGTRAHALNEVDCVQSALAQHFGAAAKPLGAAIEAVFASVAESNLVAA